MSGKSKALKWLGNTVFDLGDVVAKIKHPTWKRYYHGSPVKFDIKNPWMGTHNDAGIHMTDRYDVAKMFTRDNRVSGGTPTIYKFYAPKPVREFVDLHSNGLELLTPNTFYKTDFERNRSFSDGTSASNMLFDLLKKEGGEDVVKMIDPSHTFFSSPPKDYRPYNITKDLTIDMGKVHWPDMPDNVRTRVQELNKQYPRYSKIKIGFTPEELQRRAEINAEVADMFAQNGIPVVKYANTGYREGGGMSYMLFDKSKMYMPPTIPVKTWHLGVGLGTGALGGYLLNKNSQQK